MKKVGDKVKYYPSIKDSRYFMFLVSEGDSYNGEILEVSIIDGLAKICVEASPVMKINFNNVQVLESAPSNPASYGFAVVNK